MSKKPTAGAPTQRERDASEMQQMVIRNWIVLHIPVGKRNAEVASRDAACLREELQAIGLPQVLTEATPRTAGAASDEGDEKGSEEKNQQSVVERCPVTDAILDSNSFHSAFALREKLGGFAREGGVDDKASVCAVMVVVYATFSCEESGVQIVLPSGCDEHTFGVACKHATSWPFFDKWVENHMGPQVTAWRDMLRIYVVLSLEDADRDLSPIPGQEETLKLLRLRKQDLSPVRGDGKGSETGRFSIVAHRRGAVWLVRSKAPPPEQPSPWARRLAASLRKAYEESLTLDTMLFHLAQPAHDKRELVFHVFAEVFRRRYQLGLPQREEEDNEDEDQD